MERFLQERNVVLYRRLRNSSTGETERRMIIKLLVEEMDKFKMTKMSTSKTSSRDGPTASTCDDGVCSERRQTVCAETFRMGNTAGPRGALRIRNAAFPIASRDMRTFRDGG